VKKNEERVHNIDAFRGIAVLMVIFFHGFSRWNYGFTVDKSTGIAMVSKYGWMGVELFFLISGYVILLSLLRTSTIIDFIGKRWRRLFPAMLISTSSILCDSVVRGWTGGE
jgi:peptidoglycan/LPS O-acetylase OafA/YrhL